MHTAAAVITLRRRPSCTCSPAVRAVGDGGRTRYMFSFDTAAGVGRASSDHQQEVTEPIPTGDAEPNVTGEATVDTDGQVHTLELRHGAPLATGILTVRASFDDLGEPVDPTRRPCR
jgi:hypothetical protein